MSTTERAASGSGDEVWSVERRGIDLIPDSERHGKPTELFWVWAATNTVITYVIFGSILAALGLSFGQMLAVVLVANLFYFLVGLGGVPGARAGTATLAVSRAAFGRQGNVVTSVLSWLTAVGWEAVNLVLGAFALFSFVGSFGWEPGVLGKSVLFAGLAVFTFGDRNSRPRHHRLSAADLHRGARRRDAAGSFRR